jgi:HD-GYP domain-containing protein (c-di-GMP phosphodiesterase class II)
LTSGRWSSYTDTPRRGIPLGSRIIAVCDAFDAMTSDRLYGPAISSDAALKELKRHAGTQFDATIVDAFCRNIAPHHSSPPRRT